MNSVSANRPAFRSDQAAALALSHWGIDGQASPLPGDRDQNFRITAGSTNYVLKISAADEYADAIDLQIRAMQFLASRLTEAAVPQPLPALTGRHCVSVLGRHQRQHLAWMLTWVPGTPLASVRPHSPELLDHIGETLGQIDAALADFDHPFRPRLRWDLRHAFDVFDSCGDSIHPDRRPLFETFRGRFEQHVRPQLTDLRCVWIHNDANDHNLLVRERPAEGQQVSGLIDFGDMTHTWLAAEPAIACAYAMFDKPDPLAAARQIVAGYHRHRPLQPVELEVLFDLICMRLCSSVAISAVQSAAEPENDYLKISEQPAWQLLDQLRQVSPWFAQATFRDACGLEPCPRHHAVVNWLKQTKTERLIEPECTAETLYVHDLSLTSTEPAMLADNADPRESARQLESVRRRHGARVGIGRYDEPRLCYAADQFANADGSRRTVHLGLDLFAPAGTRVFAPLAGVIHSVADNNRPLDYGPTLILRHETSDGTEFFTLYGHLSRDSIGDRRSGQTVQSGDELAAFGDVSENGGWPPHLHFQVMTHTLDIAGDFPGVANPDQRRVWLSLCPDPDLVAKLPVDGVRCPRPAPRDQLLQRRRRVLGPSLSLAYRRPLHLVRGRGQRMFDASGRDYLDTVNNVAHVGHCHPRVVAAGQQQMALLNTNTRYLHESVVAYAERLAATLPAPLEVCFFVCSGSEATELALRMARTFTNRRDVIVLESGYHGNTSAAIEVSAYKFNGPGGTGAPAHVHTVPTPDAYRHPERQDPAQVAAAIRGIAERCDSLPAAFLAETISGCGGQIVPPPGFLQHAYQAARLAGAVCIADEVQTGFGRVGSHFWAFETQHVVPDIVTLGKPIGNGHPLAAVITTREIADAFANGMEYFNTYGGNPVSSAIGMAVLDVIEDEQLQQHAQAVGTQLLHCLRQLAGEHEWIGDVRGCGLFCGIEFVRNRDSRAPAHTVAAHVVERMRQQRILASTDGPLNNVVKFKPPMTFGTADAERYCNTLGTILQDSALAEIADRS